ncbi:MAG: hypothetical protein R2690_09375 [Acidimicrobiales bacterium]
MDDVAVLVGEGDVGGLREVLAQEVRRAGLQGLAVLHHRLDRVRPLGAGEAFARRLLADDHRHGEVVDDEAAVLLEHQQRLVHGLVGGGVRRVALLPQELARAQEDAGPHLPPHDVRPLVQQQGKVAVGLDPLAHRLADDRLRRRAHDDRLLELAGRDEDAVAPRGDGA